MGHMPGFGDSATWGRVTNPRDPRYDDSAEEAEQGAIEHAVEEVEYHLNKIRAFLVSGSLEKAREEFNKIAEVEIL